MISLQQDASSRTPAVELDSEKGIFVLQGESYPEDITGFFGPVRVALNDVLEQINKPLNVSCVACWPK